MKTHFFFVIFLYLPFEEGKMVSRGSAHIDIAGRTKRESITNRRRQQEHSKPSR